MCVYVVNICYVRPKRVADNLRRSAQLSRLHPPACHHVVTGYIFGDVVLPVPLVLPATYVISGARMHFVNVVFQPGAPIETTRRAKRALFLRPISPYTCTVLIPLLPQSVVELI